MDPEDKNATILNTTFVRPAQFYLGGFTNFPRVKYFFVFLCIVYIATVLGNGLLLSVICFAKTLHTPKYMIVFNLALADLCGSTALIPKLLDTFLLDRRHIVYEACLSYMFFVIFFGSLQSYTLVTMAYDRFIAICFPLLYHSIMTKTSIAVQLLSAWLFLWSALTVMVALINRLSFCRSVVINSFFCDHTPVYQLACNDNSVNRIITIVLLTTIVCVPVSLIVATYVCISVVLSRITSREKRLRALKTCSSHLILVVIFILPVLVNNMLSLTSSIHPNLRMINSTLTLTIPALLNPIIYALKTEEVLTAIKKLWKRNKRISFICLFFCMKQ